MSDGQNGAKPKNRAVGTVEEIVYDEDDDTKLGYFATAQDPFKGAIIEDGWRYAVVTEHSASVNAESNLLAARRLGYQIAPAPASTRKRWDESKQWVMRTPQKLYDERKKAERERGEEQRNAVKLAADMVVRQNEKGAASLHDIVNG